MAIELVDFPMKHGGSFHGKMLVHQRVVVIMVPDFGVETMFLAALFVGEISGHINHQTPGDPFFLWK